MSFPPNSRSIRRQTPVTPADEFLMRGRLPFVGRERELAKLLAFWRETPNSDELRVCLLSGEAGIGKSRLIKELIPRIEAEGGALIHTRVYPESSFSLFSAIPSAIEVSRSARNVLSGGIQGELSAVMAALRRLARLRATIVIIEDFHLLGDHARRELSLLLGGLREERLSVLVAARPAELEDRSSLENYLTAEVALEGLDNAELHELWGTLFGGTPTDAVMAVLRDELGGNPLATRSALRGMLRLLDAKPGGWSRSAVNLDVEVHGYLRKSAVNAIEGFICDLSRADLHAAGQIACLGEVFARETALAMSCGDEEPLRRLIEQGIIATATNPPAPLPRRVLEYTPDDYPAGAYPALSFVHSLVHRRMLASAEVDVGRLLSMIATDLPIFSYLPFRLIETDSAELVCNSDDVFSACDRSLQATIEAGQRGTPNERMESLRSHQRFIWCFHNAMAPEQTHRLRMNELAAELLVLDFDNHSDLKSFFPIVEELLELTSRESTNGQGEMRLLALIWQCLLDQRCHNRYPEEGLAGISMFVRNTPTLEASTPYWFFLLAHVSLMRLRADPLAQTAEKLAEDTLNRILTSSLPDGIKNRAWQTISPVLIEVLVNDEDLERRIELAHTLLSSPSLTDLNRMRINVKLCVLLYNLGYLEEATRIRVLVIKRMMENGMALQTVWHSAGEVCSRALLGLDPDMLESETADIIRSMPAGSASAGIRVIDAMVLESAILCGARNHARRIFERSSDDLYFRRRTDLCSVVTISNGIEDLRALYREQVSLVPGVDGDSPVVSWILERQSVDIEEVSKELAEWISDDTRAISYIRFAYAGIDLVELMSALPAYSTLTASFAPIIRSALLKWLEWMSEPRRSLFVLMTALLDRYGHYLSPTERMQWANCTEKIRLVLAKRARAEMPTRSVRITMLGTITIQTPGVELQRLRGARSQALLATLVADRMLDTPLQLKELWHIVTGSDHPDKARIVTNTTIHRLREFLGHEAIITTTTASGRPSRETPRLNMDLVEVDLIEADRLLATAMEATRSRALMRAVPALQKALEIIGSEVPFPGLYDEFFEAARTDFECRLRSAVVDVSRALLREQDADGAGMILRHAFDAMPDDEGIGDLLGETLVLLNSVTDSERVKMRVKREVLEFKSEVQRDMRSDQAS